VFSNLFHQRFNRHRFLESTLDILQQFYISTEKCDEQYHLFPGDQYKYLVKCMRCHQCVSSTTLGIGETLLNAPSAMLRHWNILQTHDAEWKVPLMSLPLLFTSTESYEASKTSFENSLDMMDDVLHYPYFCSNKRFGEYNFCEAVKVDLSIQRSTHTKEQNLERYVSNTMHLVKVLFEELRPAIDCINDLDRQSMQAKLDQHFTLFNYEKKGTKEKYSFDLRSGIDIELSNKQDESLKTLESWCIFFHRLINSNRLAVFSQLLKSVLEHL
jgi:hypothetical protein